MTDITADILKTCHFPNSGHGHGPDIFFDMFKCTEHPRLQIKDLSDRRTRSTIRIYLVDGKECADLASAIAALNIPAVLTAEEEAIFATVPDEWRDREKGDYERLFGLTCKAMVEWQGRQYRRRAQ